MLLRLRPPERTKRGRRPGDGALAAGGDVPLDRVDCYGAIQWQLLKGLLDKRHVPYE